MGLSISSKIKSAVQNPRKIVTYPYRLLNNFLVRKINVNGEVFYKYKGNLYPEYLNKGNAASFILDKAKKYCRGSGIDIGADQWPFSGAIPIYNEKHQNAYKLDAFKANSLDYVFSSHCLEHLDKWQDALKLWISKLKVNGILFLYLPHKDMLLWRPGAPWVYEGHKWSPTCEVINSFLTSIGMEIIEYNPEKDTYWSFYIVAKKAKSIEANP